MKALRDPSEAYDSGDIISFRELYFRAKREAPCFKPSKLLTGVPVDHYKLHRKRLREGMSQTIHVSDFTSNGIVREGVFVMAAKIINLTAPHAESGKAWLRSSRPVGETDLWRCAPLTLLCT